MSSAFERSLPVAGSINFRDVGRYPARDGATTRPGVLYRSGAIHDLTPVRELGVRTVVDLRGPADIERDSDILGGLREHGGVERVALPLIPARVNGVNGHLHLNEHYGRGISADRYRGYLEIGAENVRDVFRLFASPEAFPALVHCTAGKDRTGVIVALALDLVGVPHETIVADYALSDAAMPQLVARFRGEPAEPEALSESDLALFGAPAHAMEGFLEHVRVEHGSARALLARLGVEERVFETLESVLLER